MKRVLQRFFSLLRRQPQQQLGGNKPETNGKKSEIGPGSVKRFIKAQSLIQSGRPNEAFEILQKSLAIDPTHIDSVEIFIDLIHRHGEISQIRDTISDIVAKDSVPIGRQCSIIDLVAPYGSEEDFQSLSALITDLKARSIYAKVGSFRAGHSYKREVSISNRSADVDEWVCAALAASQWHTALELIPDLSSENLPVDSLRRALRRLNNTSNDSKEFESLAEVFLQWKPEDKWVQGILKAIRSRREKRREKHWRNSFEAAGFPFYRKRSGISQPHQQKKVLYALHNSLPFDSGGYALRTEGITTALKRKGWDPVCVTRPGYGCGAVASQTSDDVAGDVQKYLRLPGVKDVTPQLSLFGYVEDYAQKLFDVARKVQPQVVHAASNHWTGLAGAQVAQALKLPFVYEVRGLWELTQASLDPTYSDSLAFKQARKLEVAVAQRADAVITLTEQLKALLVSEGVKKHKIFVVPNGVEIERFQFDRSQESSPVVFGYIGSLVKYEGLNLLLKASKILSDEGVLHQVHIVGDGAERTSLERLAGTLGVDEHVRFFGRVPPSEAARFYRQIDVAVYPRLDMPVCQVVSPLKPFEALAAGTAVLASNVAPLAEIIEDGSTGLLHEANSVRSLAEKMRFIAMEEEQRNRLGINAAIRAESEFQWQQRVEWLIEGYEHAINKVSGPTRV